MDIKKIGEILKERRVILSMRQEDLSELSGVAIRTIRHIEQGIANPSFETLNKLFSIVGMEVTVQIREIT